MITDQTGLENRDAIESSWGEKAVLIEYSLGEANQVLVEAIERDRHIHTKPSTSKAFATLEEEINAVQK